MKHLQRQQFSFTKTSIKTESTRKLSNFNFQWTKTLYQNNLNNIALFFLHFQGLKKYLVIFNCFAIPSIPRILYSVDLVPRGYFRLYKRPRGIRQEGESKNVPGFFDAPARSEYSVFKTYVI